MIGVVGRYYAYRATVSAGFYLPVSVVYLQANDVSLAGIGTVQAVFLFVLVLSEVPTGYVGDRLGRRAGLALGSLLTATVMAGFVLAESTAGFAVVFALWGFAWTFRSGTASAWLYELLAAVDRDDEYTRVDGRSRGLLAGTSAAAALGGAALYGVDPRLPFVANGVLALLGLPVLATLPRTSATNPEADGADGADVADGLGLGGAVRVLRDELGRADLRWLVVYAALFNVAFSLSRVFEQPAMRAVGVPVTGLGVFYAAVKLVSAASSTLAGQAEDLLGRRGVLFGLAPVYGLVYGLAALVPAAIVPALFVSRGATSLTRPVRNGYLNDRIEDVGRATVLSGVSMALSLASGAANVVGGQFAERFGTVSFLVVTTVAVAALGVVLWLVTDPVRTPVDATAATESGDD
ncbi:MFS transporter [Halobaculum sp. MBLA0143]|uniref:MFS transporter n=1 Tax=Halobaculum sp. MBLA0143 TaxID=3079933 RepID=UPI003523EA1F